METFRHLLYREKELAKRYLIKYKGKYIKIEYDIHIGNGVISGEEKEDKYRNMFQHLTKKRIDMVGHTKSEIHIIEFRPMADIRQIGKLLTYGLLYNKTFPTTKEIKLILVTDNILPDDKFAASEYDIKTIII